MKVLNRYDFFIEMRGEKELKKRSFGIICFLFLIFTMCSSSVWAASYVKASNTTVSITSKKHGWVKRGKDYYFYNSKGKLLWGKITYKGQRYYSTKNGKRYTGWLKSRRETVLLQPEEWHYVPQPMGYRNEILLLFQ
mgnify:FL=1